MALGSKRCGRSESCWCVAFGERSPVKKSMSVPARCGPLPVSLPFAPSGPWPAAGESAGRPSTKMAQAATASSRRAQQRRDMSRLRKRRRRRLRCLLMNQTSLQSDHVMQVEWEKTNIQELDITATDLSTECLIDMLTRIPGLRFLSAGQINGFNDSVLKAYMELGNPRSLIALDLDSSDNLTDDALHKFLSRHGHQLWGIALSGMPHITDQLWMSVLPILTNAKIIVMGTPERLGVNIHVDQLMDGIANNCPNLERLELRWDPENLRFSDKSQKAIDILRVKCLKLRCLVLSDGRYYEVVKANFERADRTTVVRTTTNCRISNYYLLNNYKDLIFN